MQLDHGFRYDPTNFVKYDVSSEGALVRTHVFGRPNSGDRAAIRAGFIEIIVDQIDSLAAPPDLLIRLFDLGTEDALKWILTGLNSAGCLSYWDPWRVLELVGPIDHPTAKEIVLRQLPMILRAQDVSGGWGEHSLKVLRALVNHGLYEVLQELPPLPLDWEIVRSFRAPEGDLWSLCWDGASFWTCDRAANQAASFSPHGAEERRLELPFEGARGLGMWGSSLALTIDSPNMIVKLDPASGKIEQDVPIDFVLDPTAACEIDGFIWIGDACTRALWKINPDDPTDRERAMLSGPSPSAITPAGKSVWHIDCCAPGVYRSNAKGRLLEWGDKPFGASTAGLAWDGRRLWALDGRNRRVCQIKRRATQAPSKR